MTEFTYQDLSKDTDRHSGLRYYFDSAEYLEDEEVGELARELGLDIHFSPNVGPEFYVECDEEDVEWVSAVLRAKDLMPGMVSRRRISLERLSEIGHISLP